MGPKPKKGGKKSGKKKSKGGDSQMSFREVLIAYKITMKEQEVDELKFEVRKMEQRNINIAARNEHLLDEQAALASQCVDKAREWRNSTDKPETLGNDAVVSVLLEMWKLRDREEAELSAIHDAIASAEIEESRLRVDVNEWNEFANYGKNAQESQIRILEQEKLDNVQLFEEKKAFMASDLRKTRSAVFQSAEESVENEKVRAAEKAMGVLQLRGRVELEDSRFLRGELNIHKEEHMKLQEQICELENKNLEVLSYLFDCKVEDIRFSKSIFNTLFKENELLNVDENYILQTDIEEFKYFDEEDEDYEESVEETEANLQADGASLPEMEEDSETETISPLAESTRPVSAKLRNVQRKLQDAAQSVSVAVTTDLPIFDSDKDGELRNLEVLSGKYVMETAPEYGNNDPYLDYVTVGPIEEKLLAITGKKLPLIKRTKAELEALGINFDDSNAQGFFHWPENFNSSKLQPIKASSIAEKQVANSKLSYREATLGKQAALTPAESLPSQVSPKYRNSTHVMASSLLQTPNPDSTTPKPLLNDLIGSTAE